MTSSTEAVTAISVAWTLDLTDGSVEAGENGSSPAGVLGGKLVLWAAVSRPATNSRLAWCPGCSSGSTSCLGGAMFCRLSGRVVVTAELFDTSSFRTAILSFSVTRRALVGEFVVLGASAFLAG